MTARQLFAEIVTEVSGATIVVAGTELRACAAIAASAAEVWLAAPASHAAAHRHALEAYGCPVSVLAAGEDGLPESDELASALLVFDRPDGVEALEWLDRMLSLVAHDGFVVVDVDSDRVHGRRWRDVLGGCLRDVDDRSASAPGRLLLTGRREAPGREATVALPDPVPVTLLVYARAAPGLHDLLVDVLFRQNVPPAVVLVVDDAGEDEDAVPDDLWGMAPYSVTQPALLRTGGAGEAAALNVALEHVEDDVVVIADAGARLAANAVARLAEVLAAEPGPAGVIAGAFEEAADGRIVWSAPPWGFPRGNLTAALLRRPGYRPPLAAVSCDALDAVGGLDESLEHLVIADAWLRLAERASIETVALPLACVARRSAATDVGDEPARVLAALHRRDALSRLAAAFPEIAPDLRKARALALRGAALSRAGVHERALEDLRAAARAEPSHLATRLELAAALGRTGDADAMKETLAAAGDRDDPAVVHLLAVADALGGDVSAARGRLEELLARDAGDRLAHVNLMLLEAQQTGAHDHAARLIRYAEATGVTGGGPALLLGPPPPSR